MKLDKYKLKNSIVLLTILLMTTIEYLITKNENIFAFANILLVLFIIAKSKFSYFTLKIIVLNYILSPIFFKYNFDTGYGILNSTNMQLHYLEINLYIMIYNSLCYLWLYNTDILKKEKELLEEHPKISNISAIVASIIAIICSIIALPHLPFQEFGDAERFNPLLPGNAWNHVAIIALIFAIPRLKDSKFVKLAYIFVIFWFLSHYERVDIIGLILLIALLSCIIINKKLNIKILSKYIIIFCIVIVTFVFIGEIRTGNTDINIIKKVLLQNTASDVAYVFNTSIEYSKTHPKMLGETYSSYIVEMIPLLNSEQRVELILQKTYYTPGGNFLLSEPIMNFGILGIIMFQTVEFAIIMLVLNKKTKIRYFIYLFFIATIFRTTWYGLNYIETGILYIIPILYLLMSFIEKMEKKWKIKKLV